MTQTEWADEIAEAWYSIKNFPKDLKANHLHLCSYYELQGVLNNVLDGKIVRTTNKEIVDWCRKIDSLKVEVDPDFNDRSLPFYDPCVVTWRITRKETA